MIPKIINDEPVVLDNLDSHSKIAEAILSLIKHSDGGKTIGLEGAWGSGKSSVIKIFESNLPENGDIHLYKFDAWTHQGEPLRRAFLEGLFDEILDTLWFQQGLIGDIKKEKWESIRKELAQKIKFSTKTVVPEVDVLGILLILSFLFFPIGTSILSSIIASGKITALSWTIGSTIFLIPLLFLSAAIVYVGWTNWGKPGWIGKMKEVMAKFLQKGYITDVTKTSETAEPTTIEFQKKFNEFMRDALEAPKKKLIIVIDNLDRISDKEVEAIWPILRSFVDNPDFTKEDWFKRFWVIIPFAPNSLKPSAENKEYTQETKNLPVRQMGFLDKVLQINFSVPTPILSSLKKYISINIKIAFGEEVADDEIHGIFIIISNEIIKTEEVTPRLVVSLVNNMVSTVLQWPTINLVSHAYFSVLRRNFPVHEISARLSNSTLKEVKYNAILPESILLDLAVLSCNVEVSIAAQKLYGNDLEAALTTADGAQKLTSNYKKVGYPEVMATLLAKNLDETKKDPARLTKKIFNLLSIEISSIKSEHRNHLSQDIRLAIDNLSWIPIGSDDFIGIIEYLCKNDKNRFFLPSIIRVLKQTKSNLESNISSWYQDNFSENIVFHWEKIKNNQEAQEYFSNEFSFKLLAIPGPFDAWKKICGELSQSKALINGFPPKLPLLDIYREMKVVNHYSQPVETLIAGCRSLEINGIVIPGEIIIDVFVKRINRQAEFPLNEALLTLEFVIEKAASNNEIYSNLVSIENYWVFYYFAAIFAEKPRRSKEYDLPLFSPETPGNELAPTVIANLLFLWVLQGMSTVPDNLDNIYKQGFGVLRACINSHPQQSHILDNMRRLFSLNKEWSKIIEPNGLDNRYDAISKNFLRKFH